MATYSVVSSVDEPIGLLRRVRVVKTIERTGSRRQVDAAFDEFFRAEHRRLVALALGMTGVPEVARVAATLELPVGTVKSTLHAARAALAAALGMQLGRTNDEGAQ